MIKKITLILFQVCLFPFPWVIRRNILVRTMKYKINKTAKIGWSVILAKKLVMEEGALITHKTFINDLDGVHLKAYSKIGASNWITGANSDARMFSDSDRECKLVLGTHTRITGQHHLDCTGGIYIGDFTTIAGIRSQILTHSIDMKLSKQVAGPVYIGHYCFIGTSSIILMGAKLPDCSILGAAAVLNKSHDLPYYLYAGNPARPIKELDHESYKYFKRDQGHVG